MVSSRRPNRKKLGIRYILSYIKFQVPSTSLVSKQTKKSNGGDRDITPPIFYGI